MQIFVVRKFYKDPETGENLVNRMEHFIHESAAKRSVLNHNRKMTDFQTKYKKFWDTYLPEKELKDEENIKRLFGLVRPTIQSKPKYEMIEPRPVRPFFVKTMEEQKVYSDALLEWERKEQAFVEEWMEAVGNKFYKEDDEYWVQRQRCIDKLCKSITGMSFTQLNEGEMHKVYRFAVKFDCHEVEVIERK